MTEQDIERLKERHQEELKQAREVALEEAKQAITAAFEKDEDVAAQDIIDALKSQPARRYLDAEDVRSALLAYYSGANVCSRRDLLDVVAVRLGLDLDAAPASGPRGCDCTGAPHVEEQGCPDYRETATVENGLLPAPKLRPADLCAACGHTRRNHGDGCCNVYGDAIPNGCACTGFLEARR